MKIEKKHADGNTNTKETERSTNHPSDQPYIFKYGILAVHYFM